jgi:hypothetical protein
VESEENKFIITDVTPENLQPSDTSTVSIKLKNIGTRAAYHVATEVLADDRSQVKVLGRAKKSIETTSLNSLGRNREVTVQYDFYIDTNAKAAVYPIPLRVIWSDEPEPEKSIIDEFNSEELYFGIKVSGQAKEAKVDIINVTTVPAVIEPGTKATLELKLKNIGELAIESLNVRLLAEDSFTPVGSNLEVYVNELNPDETVTARFNIAVEISTPSSYYKIPLILEYADEFRTHEKNTSIGIEVKGEPRIFIQETVLEPSKLTTATDGLFMIRLINTGTESAEDTKIRISGADDILSEEHQFIGEIAPGKSQTAIFGVAVAEEAKIGKHGIMMNISYKDKYGASYANSKIYEISIYPSRPFIPMTYIYAFVAIVILSIVIYFVLRIHVKREERELEKRD